MFQLRSVLQNRANSVLYSTCDTAISNLKIFFEFVNSNLMLRSVLDELMKELPDFGPLYAEMQSKRRMILPSSYLDKVKVCLSALQYIINKNIGPWTLLETISPSRNLDQLTREAMKEFFEPVYVYIDERISSMDLLQHFLVRFKLRSEWFEKEELYGLYKKDTSKGEEILDRALRSYLFDQGINFPFSKPRSPSGEVDILPLIEQKPMPLEVKVFDGNGRSRSYVRQGFRQAFTYAKDYGEPLAYLVIFNVSPYDLIFKLSLSDIPQRISIGDKNIFIFIIDLYPHEKTASKKPLKQFIIEEKYLLE